MLLLTLALATWVSYADQVPVRAQPAGSDWPFRTNALAPAKRWFDGAGLGRFVHWGLASVHGR